MVRFVLIYFIMQHLSSQVSLILALAWTICGPVQYTVTTQDCRVNNNVSCLLTSCKREGNKSWSDLKTILWRVNSAQSVYTMGGNLYVLFPPGKIFLLCPHCVFTANMEICVRTQILTSSWFLKPLKMLCFATTGTVLRQVSWQWTN